MEPKPYKLLQDVNIKHQDHKEGEVVYLTDEEYAALQAVEVKCEPVTVT